MSKTSEIAKQLSAITYSGKGRVEGLIEKPGPGIHSASNQVQVIAGQGFMGDHKRKDFWRGVRIEGREVTAFSAEVARTLEIDPIVIGDNLVASGIDLTALKPGQKVRISSGNASVGAASDVASDAAHRAAADTANDNAVVLRRAEKDHRPCELFARRVSSDAMLAVRETGTRGALFHVEKGGVITVGDEISIEE